MLVNRISKCFLRLVQAACAITCFVTVGLNAQPNVLTANYDNNRSGANLAETILRPGSVNAEEFGKVGAFPVDGHIFAQPLYVRDVAINGERKNVLYVATMHNSLYAFDADSPHNIEPLWKVNLGPSLPTSYYRRFSDIEKEIGILSTPVIDLSRQTIYVVSCTFPDDKPIFTLSALDLTDGLDRPGSPVEIKINVAGTGDGSDGTTIRFDPIQHMQRPGLLLANHNVYIAFGSHNDQYPYHGWIAAYSASDVRNQVAAFITTSSAGYGAIWHSGRGLAADSAGNVFATTGNGDFDGLSNFSQSFLKLSPNLNLLDWFAPGNWASLSDDDADLSSMGPILIPGTDHLIGGDKAGNLYLLNQKNMGHLGPMDAAAPLVSRPVEYGGLFNMAIWKRAADAIVFISTEGSTTSAYRLADGSVSMTPLSTAPVADEAAYQGMAVSADGDTAGSAVFWMSYGDYARQGVPAVLCAFDGEDLSQALWCSTFNEDRDGPGRFAKFVSPTVVNGRVYLPTFSYEVAIYGLLPKMEATQSSSSAPRKR